MSETFYVSTPIYYVNDVPHIGHAYTTVAADVLARYHRAEGRDVFFLTGTDEHGIKIFKAAAEKNLTPKALGDQVVVHFQQLWEKLNISNDDFVRTTQPRHEVRIQAIITKLVEADEIYLGSYSGWYDESQEEFVTESAARENDYRSAISGKPLVRYEEPGYLFRLSKWVPKLIEHIESHPEFVRPASRRNEVLSKLKMGVDDLSISRAAAKLPWGVAMPNDPDHVVYVWIDALGNYVTTLGWPAVGDEFDEARMRYWPCDVHLIGKDILWFHAVYWPCLLMALGVELPRTVFAHGWWTSEGKRMQKTLGNFVSVEQIDEICGDYSVDVFRYFLLRAMTFGSDGDFSRDGLRTCYNTELANDVGNLLSRTVNMIGRYFDGQVPAPAAAGLEGAEAEFLGEAHGALVGGAPEIMSAFAFSDYLRAVLGLTSATNRYIDATQPFKLAKDPARRDRLGTILYTCAEAVRIVLSYLEPFMPVKAVAGLAQLGVGPGAGSLSDRGRWGGLEAGTRIAGAGPLFPRKP